MVGCVKLRISIAYDINPRLLAPRYSAGARSYIVTLERQLSHLRAELSDAYRSRSASQDKQLRLTDTLRERDDEIRALKDEMRSIKERNERMSKREREHEEKWKVKEVDVQVSETCRTCPYCGLSDPVDP